MIEFCWKETAKELPKPQTQVLLKSFANFYRVGTYYSPDKVLIDGDAWDMAGFSHWADFPKVEGK